jgi:hypothetical protein
MRHDMSKVIVERPRYNGRWVGYHKGRYFESIKSSIRNAVEAYFYDPDDGDMPSAKEPMRRKGRGFYAKSLNENLSPLWNFLESRVGRNWNDVYSEIRKNLNPNSAVQMHIVQHLRQAVVVNTLIIDGVVGHYPMYMRYLRGGFESLEKTSSRYSHQFYVHPETHLLCVSPRFSRPNRKKRAPTKYQIDTFHQYRLIDDIWYALKLEVIPNKLADKAAYANGAKYYRQDIYKWDFTHLDFSRVEDLLFPNGINDNKREREYGYANFRCVEKRQLGKRELRRLKKLLAQS